MAEYEVWYNKDQKAKENYPVKIVKITGEDTENIALVKDDETAQKLKVFLEEKED